MCGIVGIIHPEGREAVAPEILHAMNASLTHRGPDDEGCWIHRGVGLAMRRLSIIDLEGGHQPISNEEGNIWTVFNGEIYNFLELRGELLSKGHRFRTRSDTEVIVHLYEEEGEDFIQRLRGMFAIALWDERERKLLLYRDRIGIKPLHYWFRNGTLVFASEIKAILEYPETGREISLPALSDYLSFLYVPTPKTIYQEIHKLPPGHLLRYRGGEIQIRSYWDFSYAAQEELSEEKWVEKLRAALAESVKLHLTSDVPVGAFLSGGVDSSTVVAWMSRLSTNPVKTYSIGFGDHQFNELPYAREVAQTFRTDHHERMVRPDGFQLLPKILSGFDEPFADSSAIPTYFVSEFARQELKVVLSGDGGDELFAGYLWTRKEAWLEHYRRLPYSLRRRLASLLLKPDYRPLRESGWYEALRRFLYDAQVPPMESFARRMASFQPWMKDSLLQSWVKEELGGVSSSETIQAFFDEQPAASLMDKLLYLDSKIYLPDDLLTKVDRMSMLHSLEVRVPLLDHRVVELASSIPFSLKLVGRTTKFILKKAMEGILPPRILAQRKQGFSIPLEKWFRGGLAELAKKVLLAKPVSCHRFFEREYLAWLLAAHQRGEQRFGNQIYALVIFELWLRLVEQTRGRMPSPEFSLKDLVQ